MFCLVMFDVHLTEECGVELVLRFIDRHVGDRVLGT